MASRLVTPVSSSFTDLNTPFSIKYGSGAAHGVLGRDAVQFAGFEVENQVFGMLLSARRALASHRLRIFS